MVYIGALGITLSVMVIVMLFGWCIDELIYLSHDECENKEPTDECVRKFQVFDLRSNNG